jgi:ATP-dependent Clp protease ATP-binding subunit ClpX
MNRPRNANCSFCRKNYRDVGPLVEGPGNVYICADCIELSQSIIIQEKRRRQHLEAAPLSLPAPELLREGLHPFLRASTMDTNMLAEAVRSHYANRRDSRQSEDEKNLVLVIGSSWSSSILLARALAHLLDVPFVFGHAADLAHVRTAAETGDSIFFKLLKAGDFDAEAAQRGIVLLRGTDVREAQERLIDLLESEDGNAFPHEPRIGIASILFVCHAAFAGLDEHVVRQGRHPEQPTQTGDLLAIGVLPAFVRRLRAIVRILPLDEEMTAQLAAAADLTSFTRRGDT